MLRVNARKALCLYYYSTYHHAKSDVLKSTGRSLPFLATATIIIINVVIIIGYTVTPSI